MTLVPDADDAAALRRAYAVMKGMAAPLRVAILGALAARPGAFLTVEALAQAVGAPEAPVRRELDRLIDADLLLTAALGRLAGCLTVALDPRYATMTTATVAALNALVARSNGEATPEQQAALRVARDVIAAVATRDRLALVGLLATRPAQSLALPALAAALDRAPAGVAADLDALRAAGLVRAQPDGDAWDSEFPLRIGKALGALQALVSGATPGPRPTDFRARTLRAFMREGRLLGWPTHEKQEIVLLDEIAQAFEPQRRYAEREVDAILKGIYHEDHCTVRRRLVDLNYLARDHGVYWKSPPAAQPEA
jgi:DNA-binding transcriptional ArsR family regulator